MSARTMILEAAADFFQMINDGLDFFFLFCALITIVQERIKCSSLYRKRKLVLLQVQKVRFCYSPQSRNFFRKKTLLVALFMAAQAITIINSYIFSLPNNRRIYKKKTFDRSDTSVTLHPITLFFL